MPYIPPEVVEKAREMDLLTYLKNYEPQELVHFGGSTYCTREHDSLKISNGKWCWFSRGIGGHSALDYLIKVKEMPFTEAVETIIGRSAVSPPVYQSVSKPEKEKVLLLPQVSRCATHAVEYLHRRGIDYDLIDFCISTGRLYEAIPITMAYLSVWILTVRLAMQTSEGLARILSGTQTAAISTILLESPPQRKAIPCICLNQRLICFPTVRF